MLKRILAIALLLNISAPLHAESPTSPTDTAEFHQLDAAIAKKTDWIADAKKCPTSLMPTQQTIASYNDDRCFQHSEGCLAQCESGDGSACYWLAQKLILKTYNKPETYEPLFQRSCKLGIVSGCTNHAAYLDKKYDQNAQTMNECLVETFQNGCTLDDPWACTMYAFHLTLMKGGDEHKNSAKALTALKKSCLNGPDDGACIAGMKIKQRLEQDMKDWALK